MSARNKRITTDEELDDLLLDLMRDLASGPRTITEGEKIALAAMASRELERVSQTWHERREKVADLIRACASRRRRHHAT